MKYKVITLYIITLLFICSCNNINSDFVFEYSNIVDNGTQTFVTDLLSRNGVEKKNIDCFFKWVNDFYNGYKNIADDGWVTAKLKNFGYDDDTMKKHWDSKKRENWDINCRVAALILTKDSTSLNNNFDELFFKGVLSTDEEKEEYYTLYSSFKISDINKHEIVNEIVARRQKYGINFDDESSVKLLCMYSISSESLYVEHSHAAVVVKDDNDYYLIEKYNPKFPYQISKFKSQDDLITYILDRRNLDERFDIQDFLIMINNEYVY